MVQSGKNWRGDDRSRTALSAASGSSLGGDRPGATLVEKDHVRGHDQLILPAAVVVGGSVIRVLVSQLWPKQSRVLAPGVSPVVFS